MSVLAVLRQLFWSRGSTGMENVDKGEKWTKVVFHSTDAVEETETAGEGSRRQANSRHPEIEVRRTTRIRCFGGEEWLELRTL